MTRDLPPEPAAGPAAACRAGPGPSPRRRNGLRTAARTSLLRFALGPILAGSMLVLPSAALPILAAPALAAEAALPLEPGLYLPATVRCGHQDAATEVFNIDTRGISTNRMACTVRAVAGRAGSYEATCREGEDAAATDQPAITRAIRVLSPRSLTLDGENYRFCQALDD